MCTEITKDIIHMPDVRLVMNAGSSSLKFAVYTSGADVPVMNGKVTGIGRAPEFSATNAQPDALGALTPETPHDEVVQRVLGWLTAHPEFGHITAVGHRVVHGGREFSKPVLVTGEILDALTTLEPLAPSHQPHNLAAIRAVRGWKASLPQVACFDTGFHASQPKLHSMFGLPRALTDQGIIRYGFHGLSYEYIARVLPRHLGPLADGRVVVAHLGNGASMCAMSARRSVATTMGFSALDGLVMGRRCGSMDPGVLLYLQQGMGLTIEQVEKLLYKESGLLGVSGVSNAMQVLQESSAPEAGEAIDLFCLRAAQELSRMLPCIGGLDALVFTAGIGENSARVRKGICAHLEWLGAHIAPEANATGENSIHSAESAVQIHVIPTNEEAVIAGHMRDLVG
ncbi:acetate/propionate family kinase [Litoreibacter albidus]|uniref:Acetate kinase n=1 Tax=Litoreibacter albidus TaxID=670155 RepID=A0A1H3D8L8_9RHOB|nr:acetate/propionate family kinase [Litoreibacter albidus]SDX62696.1 acetate kinase [Litoreibacter albidus]